MITVFWQIFYGYLYLFILITCISKIKVSLNKYLKLTYVLININSTYSNIAGNSLNKFMHCSLSFSKCSHLFVSSNYWQVIDNNYIYMWKQIIASWSLGCENQNVGQCWLSGNKPIFNVLSMYMYVKCMLWRLKFVKCSQIPYTNETIVGLHNCPWISIHVH